MVYHEILLAYFEYCKGLGYSMAHLWACPPQEGDDYIFHCHPPEQKIPKPKRLQDWYRKMLDKGACENIVLDYKNIHQQVIEDGITTPILLPYFEGDYWPNVIEDCIREVAQEEEKRAAEQQQQLDDGNDASAIDDNGTGVDSGKKKNQKTNKKKTASKRTNSKKKKAGSSSVFEKLLTSIEKNRDVFFTIRLRPPGQEVDKIVDPDPLVASELMDSRDTFLSRARDDHWEFSELRRAKYSTMCMTYVLHTQGKEAMQSCICNQCKASNATWHCQKCEDFDLCTACKAIVNHEHELTQVRFCPCSKQHSS